MAIYYNRLKASRSLQNRVDSNSNEEIPYLTKGSATSDPSVRPGLTENKTASATTTTSANQESGGGSAGG